MPIIRDNLNVDSGWEKTGAWVDSTKNVSDGAITITAVTDFTTSGWTKTGLDGLNVVMMAEFSPGANDYNQIIVRATDADTFLRGYVESNKFYLAKVESGTLTTLQSGFIVPYDSSETYIMELVVFGDMFMGTLYDSLGEVLIQLIERSATISGFTGTRTGIGANTSTSYTRVEGRVLTEYYNVACFGDSNTHGFPLDNLKAEAWARRIQSKRIVSDLKTIKSGVSGDKVQDLIDRQAADIDPYLVTGAHNICVVLIGTNNRNDDPSDVWAEMQTLIAQLITAGWKVYFCTYPHCYTERITFIDDLRALVLAGAEAEGATIIDIFTGFGCSIGTIEATDGLRVVDNEVHYTIAGHRLIAREVLKIVRNNERTSIS